MDNSKNNPILDSSLSTWSCPHYNISNYDTNKLVDTVYFTDPTKIHKLRTFYFLPTTNYHLPNTDYRSPITIKSQWPSISPA